MAQLAEYLKGLTDHVAGHVGLDRHLAGDQQGKLGNLAAQLGDDPLGRRRPDSRQAGQARGILFFDGSGHLLDRSHHRPQGLLGSDAVDRTEHLEELALHFVQETDETAG